MCALHLGSILATFNAHQPWVKSNNPRIMPGQLGACPEGISYKNQQPLAHVLNIATHDFDDNTAVQKVAVFVIHDGGVAVFRQDDDDAGLQVPAGTMREGEDPKPKHSARPRRRRG